MSQTQPIIDFENPSAFHSWLDENHSTHDGIWLKFAKKGSGVPSITYAEAVQEALCYGWIDGQSRSLDEKCWLQKFTRRGPRSVWSKINVGHIERLTSEGRMNAAGLAAVDAAKADGRWEKAYASASIAEVPADFVAAVSKYPNAKAYFDSLNQANRYAIYFRLHTAKKHETRAKRFDVLLDMMKRGESIHPQKSSTNKSATDTPRP